MNAVEIEEAVSNLAEAPFDPATFPFAFLEAFGNKETMLKKLKKGDSNKSDLGGVLQRNNIHIKVGTEAEVTATLAALRDSPATARQKAKFILDILLAREAHFPATIADLYDPDSMPADLRVAHDRNDETLERICIGRRFKNDTERLEKLLEMYTQMTAKQSAKNSRRAWRRKADVDSLKE